MLKSNVHDFTSNRGFLQWFLCIFCSVQGEKQKQKKKMLHTAAVLHVGCCLCAYPCVTKLLRAHAENAAQERSAGIHPLQQLGILDNNFYCIIVSITWTQRTWHRGYSPSSKLMATPWMWKRGQHCNHPFSCSRGMANSQSWCSGGRFMGWKKIISLCRGILLCYAIQLYILGGFMGRKDYLIV